MFGDVQGYLWEGAVHCPDCIDEDEFKDDLEQPFPYLKGESDLEPGVCCGSCNRWYTPDGDWETFEDSPPESFRWARCEKCNGESPFNRSDRHNRLAARRKELICANCHGAMRF